MVQAQGMLSALCPVLQLLGGDTESPEFVFKLLLGNK